MERMVRINLLSWSLSALELWSQCTFPRFVPRRAVSSFVSVGQPLILVASNCNLQDFFVLLYVLTWPIHNHLLFSLVFSADKLTHLTSLLLAQFHCLGSLRVSQGIIIPERLEHSLIFLPYSPGLGKIIQRGSKKLLHHLHSLHPSSPSLFLSLWSNRSTFSPFAKFAPRSCCAVI